LTDYRSVEELWVFREDSRVGTLKRLPKGCHFTYTDEYLHSSEEPVALHLPKTPAGIAVEGIANLPTFFAGLLPEGVMFSAVRRLIGSAADDLFAVLAATGADAVGNVDARVPGASPREAALNLRDATDLIDKILTARKSSDLGRLSAIAGVQPKMSIGDIARSSRNAKYIVKFDSADFPSLSRNEYACMRLARHCKLNPAEVTLKQGALLVRRFDRVSQRGSAPLRLHVEDVLQIMDLFPNAKYSFEYCQLMEAIQGLGVSKATLLDALRLYVFSYVIGNGDLHAKNVSLILDQGQWRLTPAYDLLSTLPYSVDLPGADRMALALKDESFGRFTRGEFIEIGLEFGLPAKAVEMMIDRTCAAVLKHGKRELAGALPSDVIATVMERARSL
jgi:serine/threonine-protein kinase HipA